MVNAGISIVVGIPTLGEGISHFFAQARQSQQFPLVSSSVDYYCVGKPIAEARNEIVQYALDNGAKYIFWLDDDVIAPPDSFLKLWTQQKDIINGVYWSKSNPPMPLMFRGHLNMPYLNWHVGDLLEVDACGNGLTLVKTDVYRKIEKELGGPWYSTEYGSFPNAVKSPLNNTEDLYFYWKAKKVGYKVWVDTSVQAFHYEKNTKVMYHMPSSSPQANPAWVVKPLGTKLIADLGSGGISPYMLDEGQVVSFDIREEVHPDVICDVRHLPVPDETFDIVFSSHTLEHFGWTNVDKVVKEWTRILKVGGELRLVVPNLRHVAQRLLDDTLVPTDFWVLYGEQDHPKNMHAMGFTPKVLRDVVASLGLYENIQIREGNFSGPPNNAESWNLQLKATKAKNAVLDNITPEGIVQGQPIPAFYPVRIFDEYRERAMTPEEVTKDIDWLGAYDADETLKKKEEVLAKIKKYPINQSDKTFFNHEKLEEEEKGIELPVPDIKAEDVKEFVPLDDVDIKFSGNGYNELNGHRWENEGGAINETAEVVEVKKTKRSRSK